jgi:hypothetical protein
MKIGCIRLSNDLYLRLLERPNEMVVVRSKVTRAFIKSVKDCRS